jgi:HNH endonuclease/AP2 domain
MVKRIPLSGTLGKNKYALVNDCDYELLKGYRWWNSHGRVRSEVKIGDTKVMIWMHRIVANTPDDMVCDHHNNNPLDNRRSNLRNTTQRINLQNQKPQNPKTSRYKGVLWDKRRNKWRAHVMLDNKSHHLGLFDSETDAAAAYNDGATKLFGEYARLNDLTGEMDRKLAIIRKYTDGDKPFPAPLKFPSDTLPHLRAKTMLIPLSGPTGKGKFAIVDTGDYKHLSQFTWNYVYGYARLANAAKLKKQGVAPKSTMHQMLLPAPDGYMVDHVNQNKLDNRRSNLRLATHTGNMRNTSVKPNKTTQSVFKGVFKQGNGWQASISVDYKQIYIGFYGTQREAAQAYNDAAIKYHGEFAGLNDLSILAPDDDPDIRTPQKSRYKGVSFHKKQQKWCAYVCHQKKQKTLGSFDTELDAVLARDAYVKEHGLPLKLNFPHLT